MLNWEILLEARRIWRSIQSDLCGCVMNQYAVFSSSHRPAFLSSCAAVSASVPICRIRHREYRARDESHTKKTTVTVILRNGEKRSQIFKVSGNSRNQEK